MSIKFILLFILLLSFVSIINSSHFLGGTINWRVQNSSTGSSSIAILITQTYSWTYTAGRCDNGAIANNQQVASASGVLTCAPSCPAGFGSVSATPFCTDVSPLNGIAVGQRSDIVVIPEGSNFSVVYTGSAWGGLTLGGSTWSILSHINLVKRSDNGMFNNAPVAVVMSPINIQRNQKTWITVSISDADGDIVRCRWATASSGIDECGTVCPPNSLPANTTIYPNCTIEITGPVAGNKYAIALMAEDFINSSSIHPLSSVPVQFIVKVIAPPSCSIPPETLQTGQACTPVKVNETFISQLLGINNCGENVSIIDIATLSFSGMYQGSLTKLSSLIYCKTLTWTPTIAQLGYQVMCAMTLDSQYAQSSQHCFTFYVTENGTDTCPGVINNSTTITPSTTTLITTAESSSTIISTSTSILIPTSDCISWPLFASLVGLALLTMACNCCLLCHYYRAYCDRRRRNLYEHHSPKNSSPIISTHKTVVPIDSLGTVQKENIHRPTVQRIRKNHTKVNNYTQPKIMRSSNHPQTKPITTSLNESVSSTQASKFHSDSSITNSNHFSPETNRSKVNVKNSSSTFQSISINTHSLPIQTTNLSPKLNQIHMNGNIALQSYNSLPIELKNTMSNKTITTNVSDLFKSVSDESFQKTQRTWSDPTSSNVSIGYVPRRRQ